MPKEISEKTKQLIESLDNEGLSVTEIARRTNISYATVYGYTTVRQRINPETEKPFASSTEYLKHLVRQRINPETEKPFASRGEYDEHLARQRQERPINRELSDLIKRRLSVLGKNQSWLAEEIGVTRSAVSLYTKGKNIPSKDLLTRLYSALNVPYRTLDDLLE